MNTLIENVDKVHVFTVTNRSPLNHTVPLANLTDAFFRNPFALNQACLDFSLKEGFQLSGGQLVNLLEFELDDSKLLLRGKYPMELVRSPEFMEMVITIANYVEPLIKDFISAFPNPIIGQELKVESVHGLFEPFYITGEVRRIKPKVFTKTGYKAEVEIDIPEIRIHDCVITAHKAILELMVCRQYGVKLIPYQWEAYTTAIRKRGIDVLIPLGETEDTLEYPELRM